MKKTFYFLGLLAVVSCSSVAQNTAVKESVTEATEADIKKIVSFLASDDLQGRMSGSDGIAEAATFIENNFKANGVKPFFKTYKDTLSNFESSKGVAYNVVGFVEGNDPKLKKEFIIIGAHYDHIGTAKADGDDVIANGANDNASGTAAVMDFARYFGKTKSNKRSIIFALFSAEEMGLLGSKHLAKKLKGDNLNLYTMLNFEMIGIPMQNKDYLAYLTGFNKSNLASVTNTYASEKIAGFLPKAGDFRLFMRSDNYPFHNEFNVPSQTYSTFDFTNFDHYHKVGDEPSVMDFNHMASLINKFTPIIKSIANSDTKEIQYN
ncbi:peptidase M28 [Cellulophaga lytica]|uniref:M28 family metallopeptidase n=1 Tax=Cellulophaga lytica TaxID=979 RepID=UPI000950B1D5|nr:M28 family peptidase [Cellulophaga lytica]APU10763.1 peptidase M28 [Cellulophaga lytica]